MNEILLALEIIAIPCVAFLVVMVFCAICASMLSSKISQMEHKDE